MINWRKLFGFILMLPFSIVLIVPTAWWAFGGGYFPLWSITQWCFGPLLSALFFLIGFIIYMQEL